jgi:MscS family membrane protein
VSARDWNHFLEIQEELLLRIMETVQQTGAEIAFPSQTMYLATDSAEKTDRSDRKDRRFSLADAQPP